MKATGFKLTVQFAVLLLTVTYAKEAFAIHTVVIEEPGIANTARTVKCDDYGQCLISTNLISYQQQAATTVQIKFAFNHEDVRLTFNAGGKVLYAARSSYVEGQDTIRATLKPGSPIHDEIKLFKLPHSPQTTRTLLVDRSRDDYIATVRITIDAKE